MDKKPRRPASIDGFIPTKRIAPKPLSREALTRSTNAVDKFPKDKPPTPGVQQPGITTNPLPAPTSLTFPSKPDKKSKRAKKRAQRTRKQKIIRRSLMAFGVLAIVGGLYGWRLLSNLNKAFHGNVFSDAKALVSTHKLKGEDQGRVNILLAGDSADDPYHAGAQLTDSIMVLSIDTKNHNAMMISIPRDTWVAVPGMGHQKINAANEVTDFKQAGYPSGGMGQLEQIVNQDFGIPTQYYALIDYSAFRDAVNAVGGITITIKSPDSRGLYDPNISKKDGGPLRIPNGSVSLNGQQALNLARARGDSYYSYGFPQSDFDRTMHQRQMLVALGQKAATSGVIANPIKMNQLFAAVGKNVKSDLSFADVIRLGQLTKGVNPSSVKSLTIANDGTNLLLKSYRAPNGQSALIPEAGLDSFNRIQQYYQQLTSNNPVVKESPTVVILNGGDTTGLAAKEEKYLQSQGFNVLGIASAGQTYPSSLIIDQTTSTTKKPNSLKYLQKIAPTGTSTATSAATGEAAEAQGYTSDFVVVLGKNWPVPH